MLKGKTKVKVGTQGARGIFKPTFAQPVNLSFR